MPFATSSLSAAWISSFDLPSNWPCAASSRTSLPAQAAASARRNPYGSAHGDNGHQRGEYMLGHAEDLAGILGGVGSYVGNGMRSV